MARYFFHLYECGELVADPEGLDLPEGEDLRAVAVRQARGVMAGEIHEGKLCLSCCIRVVDAQHCPVLDLPFRDAVEITGLSPAP